MQAESTQAERTQRADSFLKDYRVSLPFSDRRALLFLVDAVLVVARRALRLLGVARRERGAAHLGLCGAALALVTPC